MQNNLLHKGDVRRISKCEADIKCRYCISDYSMIVVKTFWTSTSFDPEKKRDKRSWPISFNLAIRNKEKAWEEIVSSFDSHSTRLTFANICSFSPVARPSCILFHQALVSPERTQNQLAQGRERNILDDFVSNQTIPQSV